MRTETTTRTIYTFDELSDRAKEKAIEQYRNASQYWDDWYECVYDDAENVGIKITGFDIGRGWDIDLKFVSSAYESASKMMKEHGETCETYKTSKDFITDWDALVFKHSDGVDTSVVADDNEYEFDKEADGLEAEFVKSIGHDWLILLQKEEEYLTSDEAIIENIEANEWEFTEEGKRI